MSFYLIIIFILLCLSLAFSKVRRNKRNNWIRFLRIYFVVSALLVFAYWFTSSSLSRFQPNSMVVQIMNRLPQALDFYIVKVENSEKKSKKILKHIGKIRPEHFRLEYLNMSNSSEYWVSGYLGKNMVYFSQRWVPNRNMDQILEINNYIIQSQKLSEDAKKIIEKEHAEERSNAIWITLNLLLLFLNLILLLRKK